MKVKNDDYGKLGGLVKELGFLFVTLKAPFTARWYPPRDTQSHGPSLIL